MHQVSDDAFGIQISVVGRAPNLTEQVRAYAEYRLFSRISPWGRWITSVELAVQAQEDSPEVTCDVVLTSGERTVRARARRRHPVAAIDAAVDDMARRIALARPQRPTARTDEAIGRDG
jgi:ribosomal subunit interface protein